MIRVGLDEVGYGPRLGPFLAVAVRFDTTRSDLWRSLRRWVTRRPDGRRLAVWDSKELFRQRTGPGVLEPTALSFLGLDPALRGKTLRGLCEALSPGCTAGLPWFEESDETLPWERARAVPAPPSGFHARVLDAGAFNDMLRRTGNKNRLHVAVVMDLLREVLIGRRPAYVVAGRLGGRRYYLDALQNAFGPARTESETPAASRYLLADGTRITFACDADRSDFCVALASVIGKYLRERWMRVFHRFWDRRVGGLRPTAGYGRDGLRYAGEIRPFLGAIPERAVVRER